VAVGGGVSARAVSARGGMDPAGTWADPRRKLALGDYLSLQLFGPFNPVVKTLRGLAAASHVERVQAEVCSAAVSLGSLSEAHGELVVSPRAPGPGARPRCGAHAREQVHGIGKIKSSFPGALVGAHLTFLQPGCSGRCGAGLSPPCLGGHKARPTPTGN
jgi:hypothetical protein